jgi:hypothetical protein
MSLDAALNGNAPTHLTGLLLGMQGNSLKKLGFEVPVCWFALTYTVFPMRMMSSPRWGLAGDWLNLPEGE